MLMDEIILVIYIISLLVLLLFGSHGFIMLYYHNKYRNNIPKATDKLDFDETVTIQLPLYNEQYVAKRLIDAVCMIEYPKDKLEIQVLDDSTDDTVNIVKKAVAEKLKEGFDIRQVRRSSREGYKAGALKGRAKNSEG